MILISDSRMRGEMDCLLSKQNFILFWPLKSIGIYIVADQSNENSPMRGLNQLYSINVKQNTLRLYSYIYVPIFCLSYLIISYVFKMWINLIPWS